MDAINQPLLDVRDLSVAFHQPSGMSIAVDHVLVRDQVAASASRWSANPARENPSAPVDPEAAALSDRVAPIR